MFTVSFIHYLTVLDLLKILGDLLIQRHMYCIRSITYYAHLEHLWWMVYCSRCRVRMDCQRYFPIAVHGLHTSPSFSPNSRPCPAPPPLSTPFFWRQVTLSLSGK